MKLMFVVKDRLNNLSLLLKDATVVQNACAAASSPIPIMHYAPVNQPGGLDYFFLPFDRSSFVGKYSSTM
jgi:hypothetical protein